MCYRYDTVLYRSRFSHYKTIDTKGDNIAHCRMDNNRFSAWHNYIYSILQYKRQIQIILFQNIDDKVATFCNTLMRKN